MNEQKLLKKKNVKNESANKKRATGILNRPRNSRHAQKETHVG